MFAPRRLLEQRPVQKLFLRSVSFTPEAADRAVYKSYAFVQAGRAFVNGWPSATCSAPSGVKLSTSEVCYCCLEHAPKANLSASAKTPKAEHVKLLL